MSQTKLASLMGKTQSWLSRRLTDSPDKQQGFRLKDLDRLAAIFEITVPELFFDEYGQWDRRSKIDRRKSDRRHTTQTIYDPHLELTPEVERRAFAPKSSDGDKTR